MVRYRDYNPDKTYDLLPDGSVVVYYDPVHDTETNTVRDPETGEETTETKDVYDYLIVTADALSRNSIIVALIRAEYSADDELAIQRQKDEKISEYNHYNAYVEKCKAIADRTLNGDTLATAKEMKIADIGIYDASSAVNEFTINGIPKWISPALRSQYKDSLGDAKAAGLPSVDFEGVILPTDDAIAALSAINIYALQCQQNSAHHKEAINAKRAIKAVNEYDFTTGYPEKLSF